jgi:hypothetical protein
VQRVDGWEVLGLGKGSGGWGAGVADKVLVEIRSHVQFVVAMCQASSATIALTRERERKVAPPSCTAGNSESWYPPTSSNAATRGLSSLVPSRMLLR